MRIQSLAVATGILVGLAACSSGTPDAQSATAPTSTAVMTSGPDSPAPQDTTLNLPPPPADPLAVGSQSAKDDMYCSALIYNQNPDVSDALAPVEEALLRKAQALGFVIGEAGINKLVSEKAIHATHARAVADAYAAQVEKDMAAKNPRISLDDCNKRAEAIPVPE